jgi:hypothetical protein
MGLPAIALGVGLAGAAVSATGAYEAGQSQKANADYQAQVAANNAKIAQQNVTWTEESGEAKVAAKGMQTAQTAGSIKAAQGASGIDVNTGSAANVRTSVAKLGALDALTIRSNTAREAFGYEVAATSDQAESGLLTQEGSQAQTAGDIGALGTFLNDSSSAAGSYGKLTMATG